MVVELAGNGTAPVCLQITINIYCNAGTRGWSPVTAEINEGRLLVCLYGYCIYIVLGNVKISKSKEINISPVLTHYTTHELIVADALRGSPNSALWWPDLWWLPVRCITHECKFFTSSFFVYFQHLCLDVGIFKVPGWHRQDRSHFAILFLF